MAKTITAVVIVLLASPVWATYYWASPGGSNAALCGDIDSAGVGTDPGSYGTIGQAARCATVAGDVVVVKAGTYTSTNHRIDTANNGNIAAGQFVSGTSESVRTMIIGDPAGARPVVRFSGSFYCTYNTVERHWITIKYLEIDGQGGEGCGTGFNITGQHVRLDDVVVHDTGGSGVMFTSSTGADNTKAAFGEVLNSVVHDVGLNRTSAYCVYAQSTDIIISSSECYRAKGWGWHVYNGSTTVPPNRATIDRTYVHDILPGTQIFCGAIVLYGVGHSVRRNRIDITAATCGTPTSLSGAIDLRSAGGTATVVNNTIQTQGGDGVKVSASYSAATIKNNAFTGVRSGSNAINALGGANQISHNACTVSQSCGSTGKVVIATYADCFVSVAGALKSGANSCINTGTDVQLAYSGQAPDIGAYEAALFSSCEVRDADPSTIRVTFSNNASPPLLPATGATGFTARLDSAANAVSGSVNRVGDGIYDIPVTSAYANGDAVDISLSSTNITATDGQPYVETLTNRPCQNNVGVATTHAFNQSMYQFRGVYGPEISTDIRSSVNVGSFEVVKGGAVRLRVVVSCLNSDCPDKAFYLYYSTDGVSYFVVPDDYGAGNVAFCGNHYESIGVTNGEVTTAQLVTGQFIPGGVILRSNAIPTVSVMPTNAATEMEYCVAWDTDATGTYNFRLYEQTGAALGAYVTPSVVIVPYRGTVVFQ